MKRIVWLAVGVVCVVSVVAFALPRKETVMVRTCVLHPSSVAETVTCNGRVEESAEAQVSLPTDLVVGDVWVTAGDTVKKGDVLFTVDTEQTLKTIADADGAAAVQAALGGMVTETVTAPCDGVVSAVGAKEGTLLKKDEAGVSIAADSAVYIRLSIPERHIRNVKEGQRVTVSGVGFQKEAYAGRITEIASVAKQTVNGAVPETVVEALVSLDAEQTDASLRVGLNAKGAVEVATHQAVFLLPYTAVLQDDANAEYVYVLNGETAEKRAFSAVAELGGGYLVIDGFADGDLLILTPERITDETMQVCAEE